MVVMENKKDVFRRVWSDIFADRKNPKEVILVNWPKGACGYNDKNEAVIPMPSDGSLFITAVKHSGCGSYSVQLNHSVWVNEIYVRKQSCGLL